MSYRVDFDNGMFLGVTKRTKMLSSVNDVRHALHYATEAEARAAIPSWLQSLPHKIVLV